MAKRTTRHATPRKAGPRQAPSNARPSGVERTDGIRVEEYVARRERVLRALKGAVGLVLAGEGGAPLVGRWRPNPDFAYLTGIDDEPGAAVLFDPKAEDPKRRCVLFLKPLDPEMERWDGERDPIAQAMRSRLGFDRVMRTYALPMFLQQAAVRAKRLGCLHPFSAHSSPVSEDLALFRKVSERVVGVTIEDATGVLSGLRSVKSSAEIRLMKRAIDATHEGHRRLCAALEPGVDELDLQRTLEHGFGEAGAEEAGFNTIVGAGRHSTVLHYRSRGGRVEDGDVVLVDCGASYRGYCADITRVFPASGTFSARQKQVYDVVLESLVKTTRAVRPGVTLAELDAISRGVITDAGFGDFYPHGIGHHLGTEVHDANPGGKLQAGMVVTIEPGIYLPDEGIGVRLEDDVLVTSSGRQNLSSHIPRTTEEIEAFVRACRRGV